MTDLGAATLDCPHRVACGACSLLRRPYEAQLEDKRRWLQEALTEGVPHEARQILPTLPSPLAAGYRNRAKMSISTDREGRSKLGYFQRRTREVVDAPHCGVLVPELLATTRQLRDLLNGSERIPFSLRHVDLRCGSDPERQHLTLVVRSDTLPKLPVEAITGACPRVVGLAVNLNPGSGPQVLKGAIEPLWGDREVYVEAAGLALRISAASFFQVNLGLLPELHSRMAAFLGRGARLWDLYAGVGTHGLALRESFDHVLCVEGVRAAAADARATVIAHHIANVEILAKPVERSLRRLQSERPEAVILNPSRAGADRASLDTIVRSGARRLAYLSCNPQTLARDLRQLCGGGFALHSVRAVDMMPQTRQVEALALLRR